MAQNIQSTPYRQKHALLYALPLCNTCERTCRLGRVVARLEVGRFVLEYLAIVGMCCIIVLSDADWKHCIGGQRGWGVEEGRAWGSMSYMIVVV